MRMIIRLATVLAVFLGVTVAHVPLSHAVQVPETLGDRRPVAVGAVTPAFPIDHLGVLWETSQAHVEHDDHSQAQHGEVRFRTGGAWTAWQPLVEDGANAPGQWASALVPGGGAEAYQVRGVPADAVAPRAVALNTTDGPLVEVGRRPAGAADALSTCSSRAQWGADEKLRFDRRGREIWPPEFHPVQAMTVHHTVTENVDDDPAATVRAIYRYHAVDRGWGDIGYHYLVDEAGRVYEGRWSGEASRSCDASTGGGQDFAHDDADGLVTAGHTGGYNSGNLGVAVLGTFTTSTDPEPTTEAVTALENVLAEGANRHGLDPQGSVDYVNPVDGATKADVPVISGHKDWTSTECPGVKLYALLGGIRTSVADAPRVAFGSPQQGARLEGGITISGSLADDDLLPRVEVFLDGASTHVDADGDGTWGFAWDSTSVADGEHLLTAVATDADGRKVATAVTVTVANEPVPLDIGAISPNSGKQGTTLDVTVSGTGFDAGTVLDLVEGSGSKPQVQILSVTADGTTMEARLTIGKTAGLRKDVWDVVVSSGSTSDRIVDGFTVLR